MVSLRKKGLEHEPKPVSRGLCAEWISESIRFKAVEVGTDHSVPRVAEQGVHVETGYELPVILGIVELDHRVGA